MFLKYVAGSFLALSLIVSGVFAADSIAANGFVTQYPVSQTGAVAPSAVSGQSTQRRAYSYEPALVPPRTYAPSYHRSSAPSYSKPIWMTPKTLR